MTPDMIFVFAVLIVAIVLFVSGRVRLDVTAILVILALSLSEILTPAQAVAGFGSPLVMLIAGLFVVGEALYRTGVAGTVGKWISGLGGSSETHLILLMMPTVAVLSAFMSSTGAVAIFIPIVLSMARETGLAPSRLLMPLAFSALIGGMLTLIGTPPNIAASTALQSAGRPGFGFFDFTPIGAVILVIGLVYILTIGRKLLPDHKSKAPTTARKTLRELAEFFDVENVLHRLRVEGASLAIGQTVGDVGLRSNYGITVIAIERRGKLLSSLHPVLAETKIQAGDTIIAYGQADAVKASCETLNLANLGFPDGLQRRFVRQFGAAEILIVPGSTFIGKTVKETDFRRRYGISALAIRRGDESMALDFDETQLKVGDMLMLVGPWSNIEDLQGPHTDMVLLEVAQELQERAPHGDRAPVAVAVVLAMLVAMAFNLVPPVSAVLMAALAMVLTKCITMKESYQTMNWQSLVLIAGMLPLSKALEITGGARLGADYLIGLSVEWGPTALLAGLFILTSVFSQFISNTATTVLVAPIALTTSLELGLAPEPFLMGVAIAASTAFATPVASPVNTLVLGPGRYTFMDFVKVGVPLQVFAFIASLILVPQVFPY